MSSRQSTDADTEPQRSRDRDAKRQRDRDAETQRRSLRLTSIQAHKHTSAQYISQEVELKDKMDSEKRFEAGISSGL